MVAALGLVGCSPIRSERDVVGVYELNVSHQKITLELAPDQSFKETIHFASGQVNEQSGRWRWASSGISLDELWIPPSFAPDYILRADSEGKKSGQPAYTERGLWSITAEWRWGKIVLPIFPDEDINFQMVKPLNR